MAKKTSTKKTNLLAQTTLNKDDQIVIAGAGGFIAGALTRYFHDQGFTRIRAIDKKPLPEWYQRVPGVECLCMDLKDEDNCKRACEDAVEVYNLAADMGGMGFIERLSAARSSKRCTSRPVGSPSGATVERLAASPTSATASPGSIGSCTATR
jgi:hypothetical protein